MKKFRVKGMMCNHCKQRVEDGVVAIAGVETAVVDLVSETLTVTGHAEDAAIIDKVRSLDYQIEPISAEE